MKTKQFVTLINQDHALGKNEYVRGRITGIGLALSEFPEEEILVHIKGKLIYCMECTNETYEKFREIIERHYPGLCKFDWDALKEEA